MTNKKEESELNEPKFSTSEILQALKEIKYYADDIKQVYYSNYDFDANKQVVGNLKRISNLLRKEWKIMEGLRLAGELK